MAEEMDGPAGPAGTGHSRIGTRLLTGGVVAAVALGAVALGVALDHTGGPARAAVTCSSSTPKLTVQGTGQAITTPNLLTVAVSVNASGPSAKAALATDNQDVTSVVGAFTFGGVKKKDIQTSSLNLQPQYAYPKGVPTVTGYSVSNSVTATVRHLSAAGSIVDGVVAAAGNAVQVNSISFSSSDPSAGQDLARSRAVTQAVHHARAMAAAAGRDLGPVCSLSDQSQLPVGSFSAAAPTASGATGSAAQVPIEAGSQTDSAQITLIYALAPLTHHREG